MKNSFNLSWLRLRISYHRYNHLAEHLAAKIGRGIFSKYLMGIGCNCFLPSKVNVKCVYEGKCHSKCIIYEVKFSMCDAIYIGNTQQTLKKRMHGHFSDLLRLLKKIQRSESFAAHFGHHFNATTSRTDLPKYLTFKKVKRLNPIGAMKTFTKPNFNLCMEECWTILKNLRDKRVTIMKNIQRYMGPDGTKRISIDFS